jgi:hypothetical protein
MVQIAGCTSNDERVRQLPAIDGSCGWCCNRTLVLAKLEHPHLVAVRQLRLSCAQLHVSWWRYRCLWSLLNGITWAQALYIFVSALSSNYCIIMHVAACDSREHICCMQPLTLIHPLYPNTPYTVWHHVPTPYPFKGADKQAMTSMLCCHFHTLWNLSM